MGDKSTQMSEKNVVKYFDISQAYSAWTLGVAFIVMLVSVIMILGHIRNWDANSGFTHNISKTSAQRFLPEPICGDERDDWNGSNHCEPAVKWYYWKLPPTEVTVITRGVVWFFFTAHHLFIWGTIYISQRSRAMNQGSGPSYGNRMTRHQWIPLLGNMFFYLAHVAQTHWTYDGLAQDLPASSPQSTMIVGLGLLLLMEYRDRGLFFGWPSNKHTDNVSKALRLSQGPTNLLRKYHGYVLSWAAIYNFWYHPMENTLAHALGTIYTWIFLLQGSLMFTNVHLNRYWRLLIEFWVTIHSTAVALQTHGSQFWMMFFFGLLWLLLMTQLFGLPFWRNLPGWTRPMPFMIYFVGVVVLYGFCVTDSDGRYWVRMNEITRIPLLEYIAMFLCWFCLWPFLKIDSFIQKKYPLDTQTPLMKGREIFYLCLILLIYAAFVAFSHFIHRLDLVYYMARVPLFSALFIVILSISLMFMKQIFKPTRKKD